MNGERGGEGGGEGIHNWGGKILVIVPVHVPVEMDRRKREKEGKKKKKKLIMEIIDKYNTYMRNAPNCISLLSCTPAYSYDSLVVQIRQIPKFWSWSVQERKGAAESQEDGD